MKKRILAAVMAIGLALSLFAATPFVSAAENDAAPSDAITVLIDDKPVVFEDAQPVIVSDRTMVPMRAIFEALGSNVEWIGEYKMILATRNTRMVSMMIDSKKLVLQNILDGTTTVLDLDVAPYISSEDRTMVPLRAIAESFDANVEWDGETRTVLISEKSADTEENTADEQTEETDEAAAEETDETSENE